MNNYLDELYSVLKKNSDFISNDGNLLRGKILDSAIKMDGSLITILIQSDILKEMFFREIDGILVFDKIKFDWVINSEEFLPDSYTRFSQNILLTDENSKSIRSSKNVVLEFPNKDCFLEFDSTDTNDDRKEIFLNEILAKNEIDTLLSPKVFTNPYLHTTDEKTNKFNVTHNENYIIYGNNLISMHSLYPVYKEKIKLLYWDVLFNTKNDKVPYNDSFKHTSWLVMMKNRIEIGYRLLREDGLALIQLDKNEDAYLKVLMDEIFGRENYITTINVKSNSISGNKTAHKNKTILKNKDSILVYAKNADKVKFNPQYTAKDKWDTHYNKYIDFSTTEPTILSLKDVLVKNDIISNKTIIRDNFIENKKFMDFCIQNKNNICRLVNSIPKDLKELSENSPNELVSIDRENEKMYALNGNRINFLSNSVQKIDGVDKTAQLLGDLWVDIDFQNTQNEGGKEIKLPNGKKPEKLLKRIIDLTTEAGDIILDAYFGSGTTGAVAMKMDRRFIGIEQLKNHYDMSVSRMLNVINGEQGGISEVLKWQGGGSFVSFELAKDSQKMIDLILESSGEDLIAIYTTINKNPYVTYRVDLNNLNFEEFERLNDIDKRKILIKIVEKNQLYVSMTDLEDQGFKINEIDKNFSLQFYDMEVD